MKAPQSPKEITKKWVEHIMRKHKAVTDPQTHLQVDNHTVCKDLGDGLNSQVVFFSVETTEKDGNSIDVKKTYHLVAKLLHPDPQSKLLHKKFKSGFKEYLVYTDLIDNLNQILNTKAPQEPQITLPKLIYGKCTSKDFVLVMENLQHAGYEMNNKYKGLDGEQLKAAVDKMARIHAVSYVFLQTGDTSKYSWFPSIYEYMETFEVFLEVMLKTCVTCLKSSSETEELGRKIELSMQSLLKSISSELLKDYSLKTLVHGDFWNNNFMFKYTDAPNGEKVIQDVQVIDWGNCSFGIPVFDLQYLVYTSTKRSVRNAHMDEILRLYHSTFTMLTAQLGCPVSDWDLTDLQADCKKSYPLGFVLGLGLSLGTLSTTNPINKKTEPSFLDKPLLLPLKVLIDGVKLGIAKAFLPFSMSSTGKKFLIGFMKKFLEPIIEEFKSGKNEAMNTRALDLIREADENGLFST